MKKRNGNHEIYKPLAIGGYFNKELKNIILTLLVSSVLCSCNSRNVKRDRFFLRANEALNQGNYESAVSLYDEALKLDPSFADAWNNRGTALFDNDKYDQALESYNQAIASNYKNPAVYLNRSNTYYKLKQYTSALRDLNTTEKLLPDTIIVPFMKGTVYFQLAEYDSSILQFQKSLIYDSARAETYVNLASDYFYINNLVKAEAYLTLAFNIEPFNPDAENVKSLAALEKGDRKEALQWINKALATRPSDPFFLNNRGRVYIAFDSLEKAENDIDKSLEIDPENGWAYRNKGILYLSKNKPEEALRVMTQAIQLNENIKLVHYYLGRVYEKLGRKQEACEAYKISMQRGESKGESAYSRFCK